MDTHPKEGVYEEKTMALRDNHGAVLADHMNSGSETAQDKKQNSIIGNEKMLKTATVYHWQNNSKLSRYCCRINR